MRGEEGETVRVSLALVQVKKIFSCSSAVHVPFGQNYWGFQSIFKAVDKARGRLCFMTSLVFSSSTTLLIPCLVRPLGTTRYMNKKKIDKERKKGKGSTATHPHFHNFLMCCL